MKNMKIIKNIFILTISCTISLIFLTGCWDKVELEDRGLVLTIGLDVENLENTNNQVYKVSMEIPNYSSNNNSKPMGQENGGDSEKSKKSTVKSAKGDSIYSAMKLIDTHTSQNLYYGHTKAAIIGENLLNNENKLKEAIDALERNQEISRKLIILATKQNAEDILNENFDIEKDLGLYINDFYKANINNSTFTFRQDLEEIIQNLLSYGDTIIPQIEVENNSIKISGLAVIKNYKLVGWLDEQLTKSFLWFNKDKNIGGEVSVKFEEGHVPLKITKNNVKITMEQNSEKIITNINLNVEGNVGEYMLTKNIITDPEKYKFLELKYEEKIKNDIKNLLNHLKNNLRADIIGLKEIIRKNYNNIYKYFNLSENSYEKNIYDFIDFNVNVNVKIKGAGNIK